MVFDTVIKHFDGSMPSSAQFGQLHTLIDQDYESRDFHISDSLLKTNIPRFHPLPLMDGYDDVVKDLPPREAIDIVG